MDFENMTKEELVGRLKELERQRAFTYEDRLKLAILDESPFTIWASDRNCAITLWEGRCETLYGYSRDYAIGKDYVDLFVAPDEQPAARRDQISIIDDAAIFHNIANDKAKAGNTLPLLTNCFRIKDPRTGEYWNAEMGLIIDYFDQERERLELIIAESKKVKNCTTLFIENTRQRKVQYQERKKAIRCAIAESMRKAAVVKKLTLFKEKIAPINSALEDLQKELYQLIDDYLQRVQACADADSCGAIMFEFDETYEEKVYAFEDFVVDFEEINSNFNWDNTLMQSRDDLLKLNFDISRRLDNTVYELINKAETDISTYRKLLESSQNSTKFNAKTKRRDDIQTLREDITKISDTFTKNAQLASTSEQMSDLHNSMVAEYKKVEDKLSEYRRELGVGA